MKFNKYNMSVLNDIPKNNYNVVSLFSGCGGSSLGYKLAGFNVKCALEFIPKAVETYKANFPDTPVITEDIRTVCGDDILSITGLKKGEIDILDGSPPCCAFSMSGAREKNWGKTVRYSGTKQRTDDLFFEYARLVAELMPKVFVAENTKGLTLGKAKEVLETIISTLQDIGYVVKYSVLNAADYGVPQNRERTIIIGVRADICSKYSISPCFPEKFDYTVSTKEAIEDLIDIEPDVVSNNNDDKMMKEYFHSLCTRSDVSRICKEKGLRLFQQKYPRDKWYEPYRTILQSHDRPFHPIVDRRMSIYEAKRLQSFPDDFILPHSPRQNWERIGRSVPPLFMKAISSTIKEKILDKIVITEEFVGEYDVKNIYQKKEKLEKDYIIPKGKWQFDKNVSCCFDDMLKRSIPQYDTMRSSVLALIKYFFDSTTMSFSLLDIGCSNGLSLKPIVEYFGNKGRYTGIDNSEDMIKDACVLFNNEITNSIVNIYNVDLRRDFPINNYDCITSILTIMFTPIQYRQQIIQNIYNHLNNNGIFIMVEKIICESATIDSAMTDIYYDMKKNNGYTNEQIESKRESLEGVQVPLLSKWNLDLLKNVGFERVDTFWRWMNFEGYIAIKKDVNNNK